jgi:hypothetical protein
MSNRVTWRKSYGLAIWSYRLCTPLSLESALPCPRDSEARAMWIATRVKRLLSALDGFAQARKAAVSTQSRGEDAFVFNLNTAQASEELLECLKHTEDVMAIDISLTLHCLQPDAHGRPQEFTVETGGDITISVDLGAEGHLDTAFEDPIALTFFLNADLYSPLTFGEIRENEDLATLNSPLLSRFLKRIEEEVPAEFCGVEADSYEEVVGRYGFDCKPTPGLAVPR